MSFCGSESKAIEISPHVVYEMNETELIGEIVKIAFQNIIQQLK